MESAVAVYSPVTALAARTPETGQSGERGSENTVFHGTPRDFHTVSWSSLGWHVYPVLVSRGLRAPVCVSCVRCGLEYLTNMHFGDIWCRFVSFGPAPHMAGHQPWLLPSQHRQRCFDVLIVHLQALRHLAWRGRLPPRRLQHGRRQLRRVQLHCKLLGAAFSDALDLRHASWQLRLHSAR